MYQQRYTILTDQCNAQQRSTFLTLLFPIKPCNTHNAIWFNNLICNTIWFINLICQHPWLLYYYIYYYYYIGPCDPQHLAYASTWHLGSSPVHPIHPHTKEIELKTIERLVRIGCYRARTPQKDATQGFTLRTLVPHQPLYFLGLMGNTRAMSYAMLRQTISIPQKPIMGEPGKCHLHIPCRLWCDHKKPLHTRTRLGWH